MKILEIQNYLLIMTKNFNTNTKNDETWLTPPLLLKELGKFDLDPCCPPNMPWETASVMNSLPNDGLKLDWHGRIWLNPPYGNKTWIWLDKFIQYASENPNISTGLALIFSRTETKGFHRCVWNAANSVFFFNRRLKFCYADGVEASAANAPSCLVSYCDLDTLILENLEKSNNFGGKLIKL